MCKNGKFTVKTNETGKVFIVTGSNTGIGKETVWELARRGATVYMACRDKVRAEEARREIIEDTKNQNIFFIELDLSSLDSVRKFVEVYKQQEDRLDVLINNAGVMLGPRKLTKEGFEWQLGVNHMGPFLLTILLLDLLKKSAPSRIVNVSSVSHSYGNLNIKDLNSEKSYSEVGAYNQSKLANVLFTRELAARLEGTGVTVNALHPGVVDTDITRNIIFLKINFGKGVKYMAKPFIKSAKSGAQTTLYAALHPDLERVTGLYFVDCKPKNVSKAATNEETAKFLWTESEKWTGAPTVLLN
ncbi:retinol dehydrogenase 12-like isoform X2 [Drosophila albomicans]|uniref:Retinol dehydrogenase 12-like isoform X2 n=1 Tax=Drosophila albomicans TaxID=7291 RepID=A0A6P8XRB6_DROAB|nr:retinol dehydrogenase 12-like isoform X2 [Drosophila albomicans]